MKRQMHFRLDRDLEKWLEQTAEQKETSMSDVVREALAVYRYHLTMR